MNSEGDQSLDRRPTPFGLVRCHEQIQKNMKKKIRLLINLYSMEEGERLDEIAVCLRNNIANPHISEVVVLDEGFPRQELLKDPKVQVVSIHSRPDFSAYIQYLNPEGFNLLSNNDIWFDDSLQKIKWLNPGPYDLLSLTRREADGKLYKADQGDAQDSWLFFGQAEPLKDCTFPMGIPGCENRLAFLFFSKRYRVLNPSRCIQTHHEHRSGNRGYQSADRIAGPYLLSRPVGLLQFHFFRLLLKLLQKARIQRVKELPQN